MDEYKNQLSVIKACHKAIENGLKLRLNIYGNYKKSGYGKECLTYIQNNKLDGKIVLKGFCDDMSGQYSESDVLICGSILESYPNVVSEALANGLVIISTPVAGVPEVIEDGKNGYLCSGYTADDIYEKIIELNKDIMSGMIQEVRRNAHSTYEAVHSPEKVTAELEQYYFWLKENFEYRDQIDVGCMKNLFGEILHIYYENIAKFSYEKRIGKKLWYLYHINGKIKKQVAQSKCFYIWGTGEYGKSVYELLEVYFPDMNMAGYVDSYKTGIYRNKPIYEPQEILGSDNSIILVAVLNGQSEIIKKLKSCHREYTEDYYILAPRYW
ncbi:MAG: glycosyltransferase family 4 protein [Ruminococcus sp.]|nr:glycosyltransferase family 4 protein [Ruminococcus sp.]